MALVWSTLLAIAAYFLKNEVLDPLRAFKGARWTVATVLLTHENVLVNASVAAGLGKAKDDVRSQAAQLRAQYMQIPLPGLWSQFHLALSPEAAFKAVSLMIGLSNSSNDHENQERIADIRRELQIL